MNGDPLYRNGPDNQRALFDRFTREANNFSTQDVVGAAVNVLINALRQSCPTRREADKAFDEWFGKAKGLLVEHYDSLGRKRGAFPFHQTIVVPHFDARKKN